MSETPAVSPEKSQTFYQLAKPYARMGILCFPLNPKDKLPPSWMLDFPNRASKYLPQLMQWSDKMPNANLALLGRDNQVGDICFLEFDQGTLAEAAAEMGQPMPETRIHISGGKGLEHCVFRQTERSLNLGNRSANRNGREWFSLRMHNRYVVGPGSIHPDTGKFYTVSADIQPTDFPLWLVEWIEKYTASESDAAGARNMPLVDEEFDFDNFREWLPFPLSQDGCWFIVEFCPGVGRKHQQSTKTAIFWDGSRLGWKCFAQNCPCAYKDNGAKFTVGDLVRKITEDKGAYDGTIWPEIPIEDDFEELGIEIVDAADGLTESDSVKANEHNKSHKAQTGEFRFHTEKTPEFNATIVGIRMSDIRTEKLEWLWPDKIPAGNITLFGGQPGCGKSIVLLDIIARTTTGTDWADGSKNISGPRDVLLLASEDGEADTIKPRLIAADADMNRIIVIRRVLMEMPEGKGKSKHGFQLGGDILTLKNALKANPNVALVALDPISAFFGECDPNKDKEIRPVMEGIADAMDGTKCAFVGIIHNNKRGDADSISKILGASSVVGVARAVWGFGYDADDKTLRHMLLVKGNLSEKRTGMSYKLVNKVIRLDDGEADGQPVCDWKGETDEDADDMLAKKREKAKNGGIELKSDAAQMMLLRELADGWRLLRDLHRIREQEGISESTMKRARYALGIISTKSAPWMWAVPGTPLLDATAAAEEPEMVNPEVM